MQEIESIAKNYVESLGEVLPGYKFGFRFSNDFAFKYYFDFIFLTLDGHIPSEPLVAGGACGFTIDKQSKEVEMLSFGELGALRDYEIELNEVFNRLNEIKQNSSSLGWLKSKYDLTSIELLEFKKIVAQTDLVKENVFQHIEKIKNKITANNG